MKKQIFLIAAAFIIILSSFIKIPGKETQKTAGTEGITFIEQDWDKALKDAKANNKFVFLDIYATWCGPCKMLKKNTFTDKTVANFFNQNFINVSVDGEKGAGPSLAQQYQIQGYPALIIADYTGKPILYTVGYIDAKTLMDFAQAALKKK